MRNKKQIIRASILISAVTVSFIGNMETGLAFDNTNQYISTEIKKTAIQVNQLAVDFIKYCNIDNLKKWDQRLAPMNDDEAKEIKNFLDANIIKGEQDDLKKAKLIYEWIVKNIKYAKPEDTQVGLTPYEVFSYKVAFCGGFSNLYKAMLNLADIPSVVVTGDTSAGAHAWNLVYANGKWFYSDSTWGSSSLQYFDLSIEKFSNDHTTKQLQKVYASENNMNFSFYDGGVAIEGVQKDVTKVIVPNKFKDLDITVVSPSLFENANIEFLSIGKNITAFDYKTASQNMKHLKEIEVDVNNLVYTSRDGVLFSKNLSELLVYPIMKEEKSFILPAQTTKYDQKDTFDNKNLSYIDVEKENSNYSSYDGAIYNKNKTAILTIPEGKDSINVLGSVKLDNIAFGFKENLKTIMLEEGIIKIPDYTFNGCIGLKELYIPKTVTNIGKDAIINIDYRQLTIFGELGSEAERFAKAKGIPFVSVNISDKIKELNLLLSKAKSLSTENIQENLVKELNDSIKEGEELLTTTNITISKIDDVINKLSSTIEKIELDKTELYNLICNVITDFEAYTEESVKVYKEIVNNAKQVLENKAATKDEIKNACNDLYNVKLVKKVYNVKIDGKILSVEHGEKISQPKTPVKDGFTFDGWYSGNELYDFLNPVKGNLVIEARFIRNEVPVVVDKSNLQYLVENAFTEFDGYTIESIKSYKKALDYAKKVLLDRYATKDEVDMAIEGLKKSILVEIEDLEENNDLKVPNNLNQATQSEVIEEIIESNVPNTGASTGTNYFVTVMGIALASIYTGMKKMKN